MVTLNENPVPLHIPRFSILDHHGTANHIPVSIGNPRGLTTIRNGRTHPPEKQAQAPCADS